MRKYEIMFVTAPNLPEDELDKIVSQIEGTVVAMQGEVVSVEKLGRKKLAYPVRKFEEGQYVLFVINGGGETVKELERRLKVTDSVMRFVTVRTDDAEKRVEKIKTARTKKAQRRASKRPQESEAAQPAI
ncbi:MAG: 30S ribosomal protein S6 [Acidobacteriota bacterium]